MPTNDETTSIGRAKPGKKPNLDDAQLRRAIVTLIQNNLGQRPSVYVIRKATKCDPKRIQKILDELPTLEALNDSLQEEEAEQKQAIVDASMEFLKPILEQMAERQLTIENDSRNQWAEQTKTTLAAIEESAEEKADAAKQLNEKESELLEANAEIERLKAELKQANDTTQEAQIQIAEYRTEVGGLKAQLEDAKLTIKANSIQFETLNTEHKKARESLITEHGQAMQTLQIQVQQEHKEAQAEKLNAQEANRKAQEATATLDQYKQQLDIVNSDLTQTKGRNDRLEGLQNLQQQQLKDQLKEISECRGEVRQTREQLSKIENERNELFTKLESEQANNRELERTNAQLEFRIQQLEPSQDSN